jgi:hypothetical protein
MRENASLVVPGAAVRIGDVGIILSGEAVEVVE